MSQRRADALGDRRIGQILAGVSDRAAGLVVITFALVAQMPARGVEESAGVIESSCDFLADPGASPAAARGIKQPHRADTQGQASDGPPPAR